MNPTISQMSHICQQVRTIVEKSGLPAHVAELARLSIRQGQGMPDRVIVDIRSSFSTYIWSLFYSYDYEPPTLVEVSYTRVGADGWVWGELTPQGGLPGWPDDLSKCRFSVKGRW